MIEIKRSGICVGCPFAQISVESIIHIDGTNNRSTRWLIKCEHEDACNRINKMWGHKDD